MTTEELQKLNDLQNNASVETFEEVFHNNMGKHFWEKYNFYDCNLLKLVASLEEDNRQLLLDYINH